MRKGYRFFYCYVCIARQLDLNKRELRIPLLSCKQVASEVLIGHCEAAKDCGNFPTVNIKITLKHMAETKEIHPAHA